MGIEYVCDNCGLHSVKPFDIDMHINIHGGNYFDDDYQAAREYIFCSVECVSSWFLLKGVNNLLVIGQAFRDAKDEFDSAKAVKEA